VVLDHTVLMSRRPRLQFPGAVYHVMARGNRKLPIFHDQFDRARFIRIVERATAMYGTRVFAVCLMGNHFHIVLDTPRGNLSETMQYINGVFAQISNRRYAQTGHVFEERFRSLLIERETYLKRAARYVVRNPVRGKLVTHVSEWEWSTYRATAGLEPAPRWLDVNWIDWAFQARSREEAQRRYVSYVSAPTPPKRSQPPLREVYGSPQFKARVAAIVRERQADRPVPRMIEVLTRPDLTTLFAGTDPSLHERDRVIALCRMRHGYHVAEIARFLGIHASTVSRAIERNSGNW
jgi:putative transposase